MKNFLRYLFFIFCLNVPLLFSTDVSTLKSDTKCFGNNVNIQDSKICMPEPDIDLRNKSNVNIYAAIYYKKSLFGFKCKRCTNVIRINSKKAINFRRPSSKFSYDRQLVFSQNKSSLKDKFEKKEYKLSTRMNIGKLKGNRFYFVLRDNVLKGYNHFEWKIIKPFLDTLEQTVDSIIETIIKKVVKHDYVEKTANVRIGSQLPDQEIKFLKNRKQKVKKSLEKLLGMKLKSNKIPNIAFCFSGGGYRAMISALGTLLGAQEIGLLDCCNYMSSLSGSTWLLPPWIALDCSLKKYKNILEKNVKKTILTLDVDLELLTELIIRKILFKQDVTLVDIYGFLIADRLLSTIDEKNQFIGHTQSQKLFDKGKYPLPIYTAVEAFDDYQWLEFTPYEVGSCYLNAYVPTWAFGRKFVNGKSKDFAPEQTLGYLMGIYGSAFAVAFKDVVEEIKNRLKKRGFCDVLEQIANETSLDDQRFSPAKNFNFTYGMQDSVMQNVEDLILIDAGFDMALPFPPLLRPERKIDIIIVGDYSDGLGDLPVVEQYAKKHNLLFPKIDSSDFNKKTISVFKDENNPNVPVVIYLPLVKNKKFDKKFDPSKELTFGFCNTLNFEYNKEQFELLSGLTQFNIVQSKEKIINAIRQVIEN